MLRMIEKDRLDESHYNFDDLDVDPNELALNLSKNYEKSPVVLAQ